VSGRKQSAENFPHRGVDRIADKVGIQRFQNGFVRQNLGSHCGRVGHAGATETFDECLSMIPSLTFRVNLHVPCCGAHQPTPWVRPLISLISFTMVHLPSCGIGRDRFRAFGNYAHLFNFMSVFHKLSLLPVIPVRFHGSFQPLKVICFYNTAGHNLAPEGLFFKLICCKEA
jgi:hypothetical protein